MKNSRAKRYLPAALLITPALLTLAVVIGYPVIRAIMLSFQGNRRLDPETGTFVEGGFAGLENYLYWITNRCMSPSGEVTVCPPGVIATDFWPAVKITIFFAVTTVLLETILGIMMALIMNGEYRGRGLVRAAVLIPWAIPTAVTAKLWQFMFAPQGIVNSVLNQQIHWTTDPWAARLAVIIADVWKTAPFMALLILAGLQMIPKDVYEAARIDGASRWQTFIHITLPLVKPALMVAILFRTLDALRMYDLPVIMISGSSNSPTATISQLVVEDMRQGNFNSASAMSTLIFLLIFAVAFILIKFLGADIAGGTGMEKRKLIKKRGETTDVDEAADPTASSAAGESGELQPTGVGSLPGGPAGGSPGAASGDSAKEER
ncbi:sugar ABC transporter permease [Corynebacteriaceae bacterium 6-324]